jgi:hypothetical protein
VCPFDQAARQFELLPETRFPCPHFAVIDFMVVSGEVKHTVEDKNLHFGSQIVSEFGGIVGCDL